MPIWTTPLVDGNTQQAIANRYALAKAAPAQDAWYVDPTNGSDANSGAASNTALKTLGEFFRRMDGQVATVAQTVNLLGDCTAEGRIVCRGSFPLTLTIQGQQTTRHTGTVTAHVAYNHTPGAIATGQVTDSALGGTSWNNSGAGATSLLDKCIVLTSGTHSGAWSWLLRDDGTKKATVGTWFDPNSFLEITPTNTDAYKVVDFTKLGPILQPANVDDILVQDVELVGDAVNFVPSWESYSTVTFTRCKFSGASDGATVPTFAGGQPFLVACFSLDGAQTNTGAYGTLYGCAVKNYPITISGNSTLVFDGPVSIGIRTGAGSTMEVVLAIAAYAAFLSGSGYGVITNGAGNVVQLRPAAAAFVAGVLWSSGGASGQGIWCASGAQLMWNPSTADANTKFDFTGTPVDSTIGGTNKSIANLTTTGFFNTANGAAVVPTKQAPGG